MAVAWLDQKPRVKVQGSGGSADMLGIKFSFSAQEPGSSGAVDPDEPPPCRGTHADVLEMGSEKLVGGEAGWLIFGRRGGAGLPVVTQILIAQSTDWTTNSGQPPKIKISLCFAPSIIVLGVSDPTRPIPYIDHQPKYTVACVRSDTPQTIYRTRT